ncbi:MAG: TonB-dependent receptor domain-containing protein [Gemmatimonadota bacterium]
MRCRSTAALAVVLFAFIIPSRVDAQTTGSIVGRIVDAQTGAALAGADIRIDKLPHRVASGADGRFVIGAVPAGERDLRIEHLGYKPVLLTRVQVRPGRSSDVEEVRLEASPVEVAALEVRAERQRLVEPEVSTTHESVVGRELRELPVDAIDQVLELTTGVSGGHFRGGRIGQEVYVVDGVELKNQLEASREGFGLELSPSSLEEVDVITGGFGAEYGSALSGVVSYTTRRGNPNQWESRASLTTDHWAPASLFRGFTGLSVSTGGPLPLLGTGATVFADVLAHGLLDADNRARGLTCLTPEDSGAELAAAIESMISNPATRSLYCPYSGDMIPHQRGDKLIAFARFDKPVNSTFNLNASLLRNRTQNELYTAEFKYNPTYQLGQRFTGTLASLNAEWLKQKPTGSTSFSIRSALMRLDRYLGVVDPATFGGTEIGGFRPGSFQFIGEDFARQDIIQQISLGSAIPGYSAPGGGANSPFGTAGAGIFFTEGMPTIASWSRSDVLSADVAAARYAPDGSTYRAGVTGKLYRVETYERALAHLAGSMPNYARFYPATIATFGEANVETDDGMHFQFGLRVEGFRSGIDFLADRSDFLSPVLSSDWKISLMPRLGVAFPLPGMQGRTGIRFNFGRVAQPPDFRYFLDSTIGDSLRTDIRRQGNPNLAFEKGSSYEAGVNHLFSENVALGVTAFRKTLDNLVSGNLQLGDLGQAGRFTTGDFGTVNGVEVTMRARWSGISFRAGYALQKATGLSSGSENDPTIVGNDPANTEYPLAFDRRHSADLSLFFGRAAGLEKPWSAALTTTVQSGYPLLRPATGGAIGGRREATQYLPWTATTDLRASYDFGDLPACSRCAWRIVFDGRNILNRKNVLALRTNTGTIGPTLAEVQQLANALPVPPESVPRESPAYVVFLDGDRNGIITPQEAQAARFGAALDRFDPSLFFGEARQVRLGIEVAF